MKRKHLANGKNNANKEGGEKVSANQVGGDVKPADVIWVKIHKDSWWPAQILKQNDGCYRAIFLKALEQVNSHSRRRTNTVIPQTEVKEKKILLRKAKEENNKASKKGGVKLDSENAKKEMNAKIETAKSSKQGGVPKKHQVRTSDAQAKGRNRASKLDGVQKKRKLDDLGVTEKSTSKTSGKTLVKNSKQDEVHKNVEQNSSRTVKSRRQKNIQDDVLKEPKSNDSSIVDNLRKRTAKHGKVPKKHREETSFAESQERSARRLKVMQNLGLVAPFGSPFVKNGHVAPSSPPPQQPERKRAAEAEPPKEPEPEPETMQLSEEEKEVRERKAQALKEKEAGNAAYKKKDFDAAIQHYTKAMELDDEEISYIMNRAATYLEMGQYEDSIKDCEKAVERGRELRSDFKMIAKALTRKGTALAKQAKTSKDYELVIETFQKALTEHRNPETLKKLNDAEKAKKELEQQEYFDPKLAEEEREKGNEFFKQQKYPEAVKHYTESLRRNPKDPKAYSNRAACYTKLGALPEGLKDAEKCIELDPTFSKGYTRKGAIQFFMREYEKALETYQVGLKHDPNNEELRDGVRRCVEQINKASRGDLSPEELKERQAKGMQDPEIQNILSDPVMRQVLIDFQENPKAAQEHTKNPMVMNKIQKLVNAGIVQIR